MSNAATLDLTNLANDLRQAGTNAPKSIDQLLADFANRVLTEMIRIVPVRTGNLRDHIRVQAAPGRYVVGPEGVDYSSFVEFGTGTKGEFPTQGWVIKPKTPGGVLAFRIEGKLVVTKEVHHPGSRPHPYARPAAQNVLDSLGAEAAQVGVNMIVGKR